MRSLNAVRLQVFQFVCALAAGMALSISPAFADHQHTSRPFAGVKANTGTVTHSREGDRQVLTLSDDFKVPDAPAPHWQVVDSRGNVYLLQRLEVKGGKFNKQIVLPSYIRDVAKVQIWCAWAEVLLGEAPFDSPVR
jgi:hypothetical protein